MTPGERMELFWAFLGIGKFDKARKCIAPDFQFNAVNPMGATLLVRAIGVGLSSSAAEQKQCLELIKALRVGGACGTQTCNGGSNSLSLWKNADPEKSRITLEYGTHSAISWVQAWLHQLKGKEEYQQEDVSFLHKVLESFLAEAPPSRNKLAIDEGIVTKLKRSQVLSFFLARFPYERG